MAVEAVGSAPFTIALLLLICSGAPGNGMIDSFGSFVGREVARPGTATVVMPLVATKEGIELGSWPRVLGRTITIMFGLGVGVTIGPFCWVRADGAATVIAGIAESELLMLSGRVVNVESERVE